MNEGYQIQGEPTVHNVVPLESDNSVCHVSNPVRPRSSKSVLGSTLGNQNVHPRQEHLRRHLEA